MPNYTSEDYWKISELVSARSQVKPNIKGNIQNVSFRYLLDIPVEKQFAIPGTVTEAARISFADGFAINNNGQNTYTIAYIYSGTVSFSVNRDTSITSGANTLLLLQNSSFYSVTQSGDFPLDILLIKCDGQLVSLLGKIICLRGSARIRLDDRESSQLNKIFDSIISLMTSPSQTNYILISNMLSELFTILYMTQQFESTSGNVTSQKDIYPVWFLISHNYIEKNLDKELTVKQLSSLCEISESQYYKKFKSHTGLTPYQYILKLRLEKAKLLLATTKFQIKTIALTTGFQSTNHFAAHFHKQYGVLPSQYRQENKAVHFTHGPP